MEARVIGVPVRLAEHGGGTPALALHGAGVDHREIAGHSTIGSQPILIMGQSYGRYLARAIAYLRPEQARLALICPVGAHSDSVPPHEVLWRRWMPPACPSLIPILVRQA